MSLEEFTKKYETILRKDKQLQSYFQTDSQEELELRKKGLHQSLENAYHMYAQEYFDSKGMGSYIATFLRKGGAVADILGTYLFWVGGGAGFGLKGLGLGAKSLADLIENAHYEKHKGDIEGIVTKEGIQIASEGLLERVVAYLPLGVGELADLLRGTQKYDQSILARAVQKAKIDFIKNHGNYVAPELKIIPLDAFKNKDYSLEEKVAA